jgi:hypothetical protein
MAYNKRKYFSNAHERIVKDLNDILVVNLQSKNCGIILLGVHAVSKLKVDLLSLTFKMDIHY